MCQFAPHGVRRQSHKCKIAGLLLEFLHFDFIGRNLKSGAYNKRRRLKRRYFHLFKQLRIQEESQWSKSLLKTTAKLRTSFLKIPVLSYNFCYLAPLAWGNLECIALRSKISSGSMWKTKENWVEILHGLFTITAFIALKNWNWPGQLLYLSNFKFPACIFREMNCSSYKKLSSWNPVILTVAAAAAVSRFKAWNNAPDSQSCQMAGLKLYKKR